MVWNYNFSPIGTDWTVDAVEDFMKKKLKKRHKSLKLMFLYNRFLKFLMNCSHTSWFHELYKFPFCKNKTTKISVIPDQV